MTQLDDMREAQDQITRLRALRNAARRATAGTLLESPACAKGCQICPKHCAVASIKLAWWERELRRLGAERVQ